MSTDGKASRGPIDIEVVHALPERQVLLAITVPQGTTASEAIERSGIRDKFPQMSVAEIGVFSRKVPPDYVLSDGDRVEIYRPLIASPQEMRKKRAES